MAKLEKVVITKTMEETAVSGEIKKGTTGYIVQEHGTPANHACIRFLANKVGYEYDPENDDPEDKYIRIFIPNGNYEVVPPKNTVSKSKAFKAKKSVETESEAERMEAPWIMSKSKDGWQALYGHCCTTQSQMEEYIQTLDPNGHVLKIMDLSKIKIDKAGRLIEDELIENNSIENATVEKSPKKKM